MFGERICLFGNNWYRAWFTSTLLHLISFNKERIEENCPVTGPLLGPSGWLKSWSLRLFCGVWKEWLLKKKNVNNIENLWHDFLQCVNNWIRSWHGKIKNVHQISTIFPNK